MRIDGSVEPGPKEEQGADDTHTHTEGESSGCADPTANQAKALSGFYGVRQRAHRLWQGVEICPGMGQGRGRTDFGKE